MIFDLQRVWQLHCAAIRLHKATSAWKMWLLGGRKGRPPNDYETFSRHHLAEIAETMGYRLEPVETDEPEAGT